MLFHTAVAISSMFCFIHGRPRLNSHQTKIMINEIGFVRSKYSFIELAIIREQREEVELHGYQLAIISSCSVSADGNSLIMNDPELLIWLDLSNKIVREDQVYFVVSSQNVPGADILLSDPDVHAMAAKEGRVDIGVVLWDLLKCPVGFIILSSKGKTVPFLKEALPQLLQEGIPIKLNGHAGLTEEIRSTMQDMWVLDFNYSAPDLPNSKYQVRQNKRSPLP